MFDFLYLWKVTKEQAIGVAVGLFFAGSFSFGAVSPVFEWLFGLFFPDVTAKLLTEGVVGTLSVSINAVVIGTALGVAIAYSIRGIEGYAHRLWGFASRALLYVTLAMPAYILLIWAAPYFRQPWFAAVVALSANLAVFIARLLLGAFATLPRAQLEAARASGASGWTLWMQYEVPAIWSSAGSGITNEWATTLKLSSLVGLIGVQDIMQSVNISIQKDYNISVYIVVPIIYMIFAIPLFLLADSIVRRSRG